MKKINLVIGFLLVFIVSCSKQVEKPEISIGKYINQSLTCKGVVQKIMSETDYKKMHEIAFGVESTRAINCVAISDECNLLSEILNRIVKSTSDGALKENDKVEINNMINQMDSEFEKGIKKLEAQWAVYFKSIKPDKK